MLQRGDYPAVHQVARHARLVRPNGFCNLRADAQDGIQRGHGLLKDHGDFAAAHFTPFRGARVIGPAIAGFTILLVGEGWCFFLNGLSFVAVIVALLMMRIPRGEEKHSEESPVHSFIQGFRFAMNDLPIRSALLLLSVLSLFGLQYSVFLPIYAHDILHGGVETQGLLMTAAGVGALLGALQFAARTQYKGLARVIGATGTTCAVALNVF